MRLNDLRYVMSGDLEYFNRKGNVNSTTSLCSITSVNEHKYTVDVFIPTTSANLHDVVIGTGCFNNKGASFNMLPSKGQRGIVLISSQHQPILISTLPNFKEDNSINVLNNEIFVGNEDSKVKVSLDKSMLIRTPLVNLKLDNGVNTVISDMNRNINTGVYYESGDSKLLSRLFLPDDNDDFRSKSHFLKNGDIDTNNKNVLLDESKRLLDELRELNSLVINFSENVSAGDSKSLDELNELRINVSKFGKSSEEVFFETKSDYKNGYSVKLKHSGSTLSSFEMSSDGKIIMNCKDIIINKED